MELTKKELLDFETELELIPKKIRSELEKSSVIQDIANKLKIDITQLINFREERRNFSIKRLLKIAHIIVKEK